MLKQITMILFLNICNGKKNLFICSKLNLINNNFLSDCIHEHFEYQQLYIARI